LFFPHSPKIGKSFVLCLENNTEFLFIADNSRLIHVRRIPQHTKGIVQPLDVYGFRPYKNFIRKISDSPDVLQNNFSLRVRDHIIKLQSLAFNQMCSPMYHPMFEYGWFKAGYLEQRPEKFQTPVEFCFKALNLHSCHVLNCQNAAFIRCSWCKKVLCFEDFIINYHLCYEWKEA